MKIIKQGLPKEILKEKIGNRKQFECTFCGCIFEALENEYRFAKDVECHTAYYSCYCPNCNMECTRGL